MGYIGMPELIIIAFIVLLLFGARNLPEIGRGLRRALTEFRKAGNGIESKVEEAAEQSGKRGKTE